ncbi:hypothetical protein T09_11779 [Trichinella sp. T9]|nr:hypothetical protein T09_11779 [Trichinella sp. T9]
MAVRNQGASKKRHIHIKSFFNLKMRKTSNTSKAEF